MSEDSKDEGNTNSLEKALRLIPIGPDLDQFFYLDGGWETIAGGYKDAGDLLCQRLTNATTPGSRLLFPTLFCYRHFVELSVKGLIELNGRSTANATKVPPITHELKRLWNVLHPEVSDEVKSTKFWEDAEVEDGKLLRGTEVASISKDLMFLQTWCERFSIIDKTGDRFRYPKDSSGSQHKFPAVAELFGLADVKDLMQEMTRLDKAIDRIATVIVGAQE